MILPGFVIVESTVDNVDISEHRKEFGVRTICDACCLHLAFLLTDVYGRSQPLSTNSVNRKSSHMAMEMKGMRDVLKLELDESCAEDKSYFLRESSEFKGDNDCTTGKEHATLKSCLAIFLKDVHSSKPSLSARASQHMAREVEQMRALLSQLKLDLGKSSVKDKSYYSLESSESGGDNDSIRGKEQATSKSCFLAEQLHEQLRNQLVSHVTVEGGYPRLCIDISNFLRETYKNYSWDVVVLAEHKDVNFLVAPKHMKDIWFQRAGSSQDRASGHVTTENTILLRGKQSQGCFVFYRYTPDSKTTVVVFWVNPKLMPNGRLNVAGSIDRKLEGGDVFKVTSYLQDHQMDYLFAVEIFSGKAMGVQLTKEADLFNINAHRIVLVCLPMPRPDDDVSKSIVLPRKVKSIPIPSGSAQQVANQVSVLDVKLELLLRLNHPNVVRYLSLQFDDSTDSVVRRTYNIVMEFCEGTELTKLVRNVLPMSTVVDFSKQILWGLEYLHDNDFSHRALYGDHVMVRSFETNGGGRVQLISIARIRELCPRENQSFDSNQSDRILPLFMPPEVAESVGSKTDIWSFGCVMIQMITGDWPVMKKRQFSATVELMMPQIPKQIPWVLGKVIQQCLQLEYDKRPKARDLLKQLQESHGEFEGLSTPPRQLIDNRKRGPESFFKEF
ncbi:putative Mitogen-activated protein kinase kinase kinase 2 [Hypsibius exemplaris]|uniref:Mitogen-activated protein kinase kinase kinase 2 n=1 Tax=Hypsibius exemplaris TaxID=2072580 RepID=A0A1W0WE71_HYPEX|nr:putative Mitogen-activated protein kinase kinase kinase 2 [Hypsibius exemplaris]